jgi:hypothetical protein
MFETRNFVLKVVHTLFMFMVAMPWLPGLSASFYLCDVGLTHALVPELVAPCRVEVERAGGGWWWLVVVLSAFGFCTLYFVLCALRLVSCAVFIL